MLDLRGSLPVLVLAMALSMAPVFAASPRTITMDDRIAAQRAIEEVYWRHRIWPKENPGPKPSLDKVMPQALLSGRVESYLKMSNTAASIWHRPITGQQLQAELDRIGRSSRDPKLLREIFDALGNDAELIAETLVRQTLVDRLIRNCYAGEHPDGNFDAWWSGRANTTSVEIASDGYGYKLPTLPASTCTNDTWRATYTDLPEPRAGHHAIWTGSEMLIWGGFNAAAPSQGGGRYNPVTDTWAPMARDANAPPAADYETAVWTGTEMIIWGGIYSPANESGRVLNSGARYDPMTDAWTPTSTGTGVPSPRYRHTAVWTGTEMIIWGGQGTDIVSTGGRYLPATDSWIPTSTGPGVPSARQFHTAVWTGAEMLVWGGSVPGLGSTNTGGRYDPSSDSWSALSTIGAPSGRTRHTTTWTGNRMVVFGGIDTSSAAVNTGGRYDPATDTWAPTISTPGIAPEPRYDHVAVSTGSKLIVFGGVITPSNGRVAYTYDPSGDAWSPVSAPPISRRSCSAVWTGTELIVWGGGNSNYSNDGERYDPSSDTWSLTSTATTVPEGRHYSAAVWTGTEMIVWGGANSSPGLTAIDSGGRYMPATDSWTPTSRGAGVPAARYFHTAVWTGREMIVWGGWSSTANGSLNSGGRYDPITDRWLPTSTGANVPSARSQHKAVWTGNKMVVIGGGTGGGRYDPLTDTWLPVSLGPGAPTPGNLGTVWTGMELLAWPGGSSDGGRYDPVNDTWAAFPSGNGVVASRIEYSTVWSGSEMIVWGGSPNTNTGGRFNPLTSLWTPTSTGANVPTERLEHAAVWTGSEMIIFGGVRSGNPAPFNGGGRYVPASDSWSPVATAGAPANTPVQSAVWTGTQLIVWSGISNTNTGGLYCACPNGALFYRDADGDGFGDPGLSAPSCDGSAPAGYVDDHTDCNDAAASAYPGAAEVCNGIDDNCDGLVDEGASGIDADGDLVAGACDNCPLVANATQSDFDHDGEGDACDLNDGEIWQGRDDKTSVSWQPEEGPTAWNVYTGDLDALRSTGIYTQVPGSNALADRQCHLLSTVAAETNDPAPGKASYTLVTGVTGGVEGSLGSSSAGSRPNTNPCP